MADLVVPGAVDLVDVGWQMVSWGLFLGLASDPELELGEELVSVGGELVVAVQGGFAVPVGLVVGHAGEEAAVDGGAALSAGGLVTKRCGGAGLMGVMRCGGL